MTFLPGFLYGNQGNDAFTKLLLHCDGANGSTIITDSSQAAHGNATIIGGAQLSTASPKFGSAALALGAAGNYCTFPDSADWAFGNGDFTIDYWAQVAGVTNGFSVFQETATSGFQLSCNTAFIDFQYLVLSTLVFQRQSHALGLIPGVWHHFAVVRNGANWFHFVGGVSQGFNISTGAIPNFADVAAVLTIGGQVFTGVPLLDELRISKGIARWTANFTPPVRAYG